MIHPTAIIDPRAQIGGGVEIGAYSVLKGRVTIGEGTIIAEACHVHGPTMIGRGCRIGPAAFVGLDPQHLSVRLDPVNPTYLVIGDEVIVREGTSVHRATRPGIENATRIGDKAFVMGGVHIAHDCVIGHEAILANGSLVAGHCEVGSRAFLGGGCALHQFVRVGRLVVVGGNEAIPKDLPPFAAAWDGRLKGYNAVGCRRAGLSREAIKSISAAYQCLHSHRFISSALAAIRAEVPQTPEVLEILEFIGTTKRGIQSARRDAGDESAVD